MSDFFPFCSFQFPGDENLTPKPPTIWVNAMLGRMFWDFLTEKYWADQVSDKIQKKLGRIKVRKAAFPCLLEQTSRGQVLPCCPGRRLRYPEGIASWVQRQIWKQICSYTCCRHVPHPTFPQHTHKFTNHVSA